MRLAFLSLIIIAFVCATGCKKESKQEPGVETSAPKIVSLTSDKTSIKFGGDDPAIITCECTGGEISYEWEVDLGDIFVLNADGSQVRFTGSECCIGEKVITCKASNDKGTISETIIIVIENP